VIDEVFFFFVIFANGLYVDIDVDFLDTYFDSKRNMIRWLTFVRVKYVMAKSHVIGEEEYKIYNRIRVPGVICKSSRSRIRRGG